MKQAPHLAALNEHDRNFEAVVTGEPQQAFHSNQFSLTFPAFVHYGVSLWVPEVGGAIDPGSAHDVLMNLFSGMSKCERSWGFNPVSEGGLAHLRHANPYSNWDLRGTD